MNITLRPHHFLCILSFKGKGYSVSFIKNMKKIVHFIKTNPNIPILVTDITDDICAPCPSKINNKCLQQKKIEYLDANHARILKIKSNDKVTWNQALDKIKKNMSLENFHLACDKCNWKKFGYCESVLTDFLNDEKTINEH